MTSKADKLRKIQALIDGAKTEGERSAAMAAFHRVRAPNQAAVEMGRKGGSARVPKGFSKMSKRKRTQVAKKAAAKRWRA